MSKNTSEKVKIFDFSLEILYLGFDMINIFKSKTPKKTQRYRLNLRAELRKRGISVKQYAKITGMTESKIKYLCSDKPVSVDLRDLYIHQKFLDCKLSDLLIT